MTSQRLSKGGSDRVFKTVSETCSGRRQRSERKRNLGASREVLKKATYMKVPVRGSIKLVILIKLLMTFEMHLNSNNPFMV